MVVFVRGKRGRGEERVMFTLGRVWSIHPFWCFQPPLGQQLRRPRQRKEHHTASMVARVLTCSFWLPSFEICRNVSTP